MRKKPPDRAPEGNLSKTFSRDSLEDLKGAHVVFGVDVNDQSHATLFFGRGTLERIVKSGEARECKVVKLPVDFATDDVEFLAALCLTQLGSCCYNRETLISPRHN